MFQYSKKHRYYQVAEEKSEQGEFAIKKAPEGGAALCFIEGDYNLCKEYSLRFLRLQHYISKKNHNSDGNNRSYDSESRFR